MKNIKYIISIIVLALIVVVLWFKSNKLSNDIDIITKNYHAARDAISVYKLKNKDLMYEKGMYIVEIDEFYRVIGEQNDYIKDIESKLNANILYISKLESQINIKDTIHSTDSIIYYPDSTMYSKHKYDTKWLRFDSNISFNTKDMTSSLDIYNINIPLTLTTGVDSNHNIFITSDNPYLQINEIKGASDVNKVLNKNDKKFTIVHGINLGFGATYGLIGKSFDIGPQIGYSLTFEF